MQIEEKEVLVQTQNGNSNLIGKYIFYNFIFFFLYWLINFLKSAECLF